MVRKRVLKYKPAVKLEKESARELAMRLLGEAPKLKRERVFAGITSHMKRRRMSEEEREQFAMELTEIRREIEEEERGGGLKTPKKRIFRR